MCDEFRCDAQVLKTLSKQCVGPRVFHRFPNLDQYLFHCMTAVPRFNHRCYDVESTVVACCDDDIAEASLFDGFAAVGT